eukprot:CAMPEP_0172442254 /NCGR_PEP_ID=MMETSP1065-20121228/2723_1 /TAXON_ID=265537 /ORGANISM="Amphiprora paludosa, Strain CCMP125" /LENGTH=363 /DNA_ID=CAMNT_0013192049 /DNA_START=165 /DNA_END=1256 /DNA_ORIENTATION=+
MADNSIISRSESFVISVATTSQHSSIAEHLPHVNSRTRFLTEDAFVAPLIAPGEMNAEEQTPRCLSMTRANPFHSFCEGDDEFENTCEIPSSRNMEDDDASDISSISNDSRRRYGSAAAGTDSEARDPPPTEISVPSARAIQIVPQLLVEESSQEDVDEEEQVSKEQHVKRNGPIHTKLARPVGVFRGVSGPSVASASVYSTPAAALFRDASIAGSATTHDYEMLGNRPRRTHHRGPSQAFSIGSLVGQSSYITAPTSASSVSPSTDSVGHHLKTAKNHHIRNHVHMSPSLQSQSSKNFKSVDPPQLVEKLPRARRRNPMKQEMLHVLGKVASPVKKLAAPVKKMYAGTEKIPDLRRSSGCLA